MLLLSAPMQHISENSSVILDANKLTEKLNLVDDQDIEELTLNLTNDARQFNELQCDSKKRLKLLEVYYSSLADMLSSIDDMKLRALQYSDSKRLKIEEDIMWLYLELANGYKILIKEYNENGVAAREDGGYLHSIFRALEVLSLALVYAYKARLLPPPLCFLEINQLYFLSEREGCLTQHVNSVKKERKDATIDKLYKQIMLLAAFDPYALNSDEVVLLYDNFANHVNDCLMISSGVVNSQPGHYLIDLNEDRWPRRVTSAKTRQMKDDQRLLDISSVIQNQTTYSYGSDNIDYFSSREKQIIRIALNSIKNDYYISNTEKATGVKINMSIGLDSVLYYTENASQMISEEVVETCAGIEVHSFDSEETGYEISSWNVMQVKGNIHHITCDSSRLNQTINVGEMAIINNVTDTSNGISLALIRWVQHADEEVHVVIEYLPESFREMTIKPADGDYEPTQALYFVPDNMLRLPASILIENIVISESNSYLVEIENREFKVALNKRLLETQVFSLCSFKVDK